ncbi:unnamed protein product [Rotaria sp. Silwood1]|nr:unnamed protein product [Rotaria sp. Silwood1]CAF1093056.1 unnamed protein product [Rotaria sp. Silwood1]CAF1098699.1 unnamed protein product [Rotaria sp. Silwood1]CAF3417675.1 unnamed protein product [Rotaria sp. Silwood1]CAF3441821.1 unnamed protein product [Rotaria sp. Silwood1]
MYKTLDEFSTKNNETFYSYTSTSSVVLSQKASRFWIPFDVKLFETLTPKEYLEKYCRVNSRRYALYKRTFDKYKDIEAELNMEVLADALADAYMGTIDNRLIRQVIVLLDLSSNEKITFTQFSGIAAFSERYFFNIFTRFDDIDLQLQKDILEILDFSSLKWKLSGVNISPRLREILRLI